MSEGTDILSAGLDLLGGVMGTKSGTVTQADGTALPFTGAVPSRRRRAGAGGDRDAEELELRIPAGEISARPEVEAQLVFTGESGAWLIQEASPVTAGSSVLAWRLLLRTWTNREDETGEGT